MSGELDAGARRGLVLSGVMAAVFLAAMESTVVATAMPTVIASLGGIRIYSWTFSAFLLTSTVTMPIWGRLADQLGRRPAYLAGLALFLLGSALAGLSRSMEQLIAFRALQGLGAGSLISIGMTIVGDLYGVERRAKMQGYFSSVWGVASLVGPLVGGLLTDRVSWRWVFYINLPFGLLSAAAMPTMATADIATLRTFSGTALVLGIIAHGAISVLTGLLYAVILPMLPRRHMLWGGLVAPLLWTGLIWALLGVINPALNARVDWIWFIASQIAFGLAAGFVVAKAQPVATMQTWSLAARAGVEATGSERERKP